MDFFKSVQTVAQIIGILMTEAPNISKELGDVVTLAIKIMKELPSTGEGQ